MRSKEEDILRSHLVELLRGGSAHVDVDSAFEGVAAKHWGIKSHGAPHSLWELLEHTRFTLHDLVDFCTNAHYVAPEWPAAYWPSEAEPSSSTSVEHSLKNLKKDLLAMEKIVQDHDVDLYARIPWGEGQTVLREALLAADHTSYHVGQAMFLRKQLESGKQD